MRQFRAAGGDLGGWRAYELGAAGRCGPSIAVKLGVIPRFHACSSGLELDRVGSVNVRRRPQGSVQAPPVSSGTPPYACRQRLLDSSRQRAFLAGSEA